MEWGSSGFPFLPAPEQPAAVRPGKPGKLQAVRAAAGDAEARINHNRPVLRPCTLHPQDSLQATILFLDGNVDSKPQPSPQGSGSLLLLATSLHIPHCIDRQWHHSFSARTEVVFLEVRAGDD